MVAKPGKCTTPEKSRFYVKREAQHYADRMTAEHGKKISVYQCGMHFHLTSGGRKAREQEERAKEGE